MRQGSIMEYRRHSDEALTEDLRQVEMGDACVCVLRERIVDMQVVHEVSRR